MTRKSKREIERALDALADGSRTSTPGDVSNQVREAVRAALAYRYANYGTVDRSSREAFLRDAAAHVDEPHAATLRELVDGRGSA